MGEHADLVPGVVQDVGDGVADEAEASGNQYAHLASVSPAEEGLAVVPGELEAAAGGWSE
ncbi:hypothetical protein GCM10023317_90430 [Actinopolymorpha pittospori]